jgi:hypothetical protein
VASWSGSCWGGAGLRQVHAVGQEGWRYASEEGSVRGMVSCQWRRAPRGVGKEAVDPRAGRNRSGMIHTPRVRAPPTFNATRATVPISILTAEAPLDQHNYLPADPKLTSRQHVQSQPRYAAGSTHRGSSCRGSLTRGSGDFPEWREPAVPGRKEPGKDSLGTSVLNGTARAKAQSGNLVGRSQVLLRLVAASLPLPQPRPPL